MNATRFFSELKRRNVYKVAVAYAVVGWLLIQVATQVFPFFEIPNWAVRLVVLVIVVGFPIALVIAWAFELTPEGIKRTEAAAPRARHHAWIYLVVIAAALSLVLFFFARRIRSPNESSEKSIAVLPFEYLSQDKADSYFADGIQDEILTRLSRINQLKVISRTSTEKYKSVPTNLREIAQQLGVKNVLEGSVQKAADQVRITVQLINANNDAHLWAETYDRKLVDVFQVESDVAQKIAGSLEAKLTGKEKAALEQHGTSVPAAYDAYLHGLALRNAQTDADAVRSRDFFREAVQLDPQFASAWAELAVAESNRFFFPEESPEQKQRAQTATETALRLAPDSAEAQGAMGLYLYYVEKNYDEALRWLERAREIAPNDARLITASALVKRRQGKLDECIALQKRAAELDPLNLDIWANLGRSFRGRRDLTQARAMFERALAISPNDMSLIVDKAETFLAAGDLDTAWKMVRDLKPPPSDYQVFGFTIGLLVLQRRFEEAIQMVKTATEGATEPLQVALTHAALGMGYRQIGNVAAASPLLAQAANEFNKLREKHEGGLIVLEQLSRIKAIQGDRQAVDEIDAEYARRRSFDKWTAAYIDEQIGVNYAIMADAATAVPHLERALHSVYANALTSAYLRFDPIYDAVRNDPRFQKIANEPL